MRGGRSAGLTTSSPIGERNQKATAMVAGQLARKDTREAHMKERPAVNNKSVTWVVSERSKPCSRNQEAVSWVQSATMQPSPP